MADTQDLLTPKHETCYDKYNRVISEEEYIKLVDQYNEDFRRHSKNTPEALEEYNRNAAVMREEIAQCKADAAKKPVPKKTPSVQQPIGGYQNIFGKSITLAEYMRLPKMTRAAIFNESVLEGREWTSVSVSIDNKVFWSSGLLDIHAIPMGGITSIFAKEHSPRIIDLEFMLYDGRRIGYYVYNKTAEKIVEYFTEYLHRDSDSALAKKADPPQ